MEQNSDFYNLQQDFDTEKYANDAYIIDGETDEFDAGGSI